MKLWEDYYHILQVHHDAEQEVIEGAYRRLCKKYHPDINRSESSEEKIKKINTAYETLKDQGKRKEYHKLWLGMNGRSNKQAVNERQWKKGFDPVGNEKARNILNNYLTALSEKKFEKAYSLLSDWNKKNISLDEFIQWREAVSKMYDIGSFESRIFNTHKNKTLKGAHCEKVIEFDINISEKNLHTGKVTEYRFTKMIGMENKEWKVFLEYHDLKALAHKFRYLYHSNTKASAAQVYADMQLMKDETTGLLSKKGFLTELEKEKNRFLRYVSPFCIGIFGVKVPDNKDYNEYIKYAAYSMVSCIRNTDIPAYIDPGVFAVIFTETSYNQAQTAVSNIIRKITNNFLNYYGLEVSIRHGLCEHTGREEIETFYKACSNANVELNQQDSDGFRFKSAHE